MAELTDIVPLIQNGEFVTTELQHLRVIFDKKKAEFTL
jgi:hypothetical protein